MPYSQAHLHLPIPAHHGLDAQPVLPQVERSALRPPPSPSYLMPTFTHTHTHRVVYIYTPIAARPDSLRHQVAHIGRVYPPGCTSPVRSITFLALSGKLRMQVLRTSVSSSEAEEPYHLQPALPILEKLTPEGPVNSCSPGQVTAPYRSCLAVDDSFAPPGTSPLAASKHRIFHICHAHLNILTRNFLCTLCHFCALPRSTKMQIVRFTKPMQAFASWRFLIPAALRLRDE